MKYYVVAGEASGDLHGSNLIREIKALDPTATFRCWGGDLMEEAGGELVRHYRDLAFMGFVEVVKNLNTILANIKFCEKDILKHQPDAIILIDYPGFNLRIADWGRKKNFKIIYYISPQIWAWKERRVLAIKRNVNKMLVILPFEKDFYKKWDYEVEYVGHPLIEVLDKYMISTTPKTSPTHTTSNAPADLDTPITSISLANEVEKRPFIALLPGSRKQEIIKKLPIMLEVTKKFPAQRFVVARAPGIDDLFYDILLKDYPKVTSARNETYKLLSESRAALVTSGTATLETALFRVPQVVCYKGSTISYQIARRVIKTKYISLVNLIMDKEVVKELIQDNLTEENLVVELDKILYDQQKQQDIQEDYTALKKLLNKGGNASKKAAESIVAMIGKGPSTSL